MKVYEQFAREGVRVELPVEVERARELEEKLARARKALEEAASALEEAARRLREVVEGL